MKKTKKKTLYFSYFRHLFWVLVLFVGIIIGLTVAFYSYFKLKTEKVIVPNMVGMSVLDAVDILQRNELKPYIVPQVSKEIPRFVVMGQETTAGDETKRGREVVITVSSGETLLKLPDYIGKNYFQIKAFSEGLDEKERKFFIKDVKWVDSAKPFGEIVGQNPLKEKLLDQLTGLTFWVSTGRETRVPSLANLYLEEAVQALSAQDLNFTIKYKTVTDANQDGKVVGQSPGAGAKTERFQAVNLSVGRWEKKQGAFQLLHFVIPDELSRRKIRIAFYDARGKQIVYEGRAFLGEDFVRVIRSFGESRCYVYTLDGNKEEFYKELQL